MLSDEMLNWIVFVNVDENGDGAISSSIVECAAVEIERRHEETRR